MAAPFIGPLDAEQYLAKGLIEQVLCGWENYDGARPCHFEWVETLSFQCRAHGVTFDFIETGTVFVKEGSLLPLHPPPLRGHNPLPRRTASAAKLLKDFEPNC